ncbi:MAG: tRNA uridine-5-carboxymethylaminomethyl(34) synthesis GTPase MnmE [Spirochaetales bacterium]|jgi:tRNA modification GTPase|nr:tRNA uridine-5-carboxymethylaminomethyl(34) synthesis GTPase MnmE [Spirochaetales bacterium]
MNSSLDAYNTGDCIAALATAWGQSALAIIRASGEGSIERMTPAFSRPEKLRAARGKTLLHGLITDPKNGEPVDDVMLSVFRGGEGYTGEEAFEIYCHGSLPGIRRILEILRGLGFRPAQPGEFTFRAFCNGKMDLTRAEAVQEIVSAQTGKAHSLALHRLAGSIAQRINAAKDILAEILAGMEIRLDYPEEDAPDSAAAGEARLLIAQAEEILERLLAGYTEGRLYQEGVCVAFAGRTNAGKSSLFNFFLKEDRSIVSEAPGTTRDYIEAVIPVAGIPVKFYDTAGLRDSSDPVETEGVRRSRRLLDAADLILYLVDASQAKGGRVPPEDKENILRLEEGSPSGRVLAAWNKIDIAASPLFGDDRAEDELLRISARTGEGVPELLSALEKRLAPRHPIAGEETLTGSSRQRDLLEKSLAAIRRFRSREGKYPLDILAEDIREALNALGEITGEVTTEEMLALMFSRFCVGK